MSEGPGNRFFAKASDGILAHVKKLTPKRNAIDHDYWRIDLPRSGRTSYNVWYIPDLVNSNRLSSRRHLYQKDEVLQTRKALIELIEDMLLQNSAQLNHWTFEALKR